MENEMQQKKVPAGTGSIEEDGEDSKQLSFPHTISHYAAGGMDQ